MGTRGAYGFRIDEADKVTYNHFDSYPTGLGRDLLGETRRADHTKLREVAQKLILVDDNSKPTHEQIELLARYADTDVSTKRLDEWYVLLRKAQGSLSPWIDDGVPVMIDNHNFLADSLFCEWAYIINLDDGVFEVYRGFNKQEHGVGRYASLHRAGDGGYFGVALVAAMPLDELCSKSDGELDSIVERWDQEEGR